MGKARNIGAIRDWVVENRPDMTDHIDRIVSMTNEGGEGFILLMTTCFEAGRQFQSKLDDPSSYAPMDIDYYVP